jgi:urease accessory protein
MSSRPRLSAVAAALALAPAAAQAHAPFAGAGDFYAGLLHPITAVEHAVPLLALGLLAGQQPPGEQRYWAAFVCAAAAVAGAASVALLPTLTWVQHANAAAALLMGALVAAAWPPPAPIFYGLAMAVGLGLGYLHGLELGAGLRPGPFVGGLATAIVLVLIYCAALVSNLRPRWARIGVRVGGSWVAAVSGLVLGLAFR